MKVGRFCASDRDLYLEIARLIREQGMSLNAATLALAEQGRVAGTGINKSKAARLARAYGRDNQYVSLRLITESEISLRFDSIAIGRLFNGLKPLSSRPKEQFATNLRRAVGDYIRYAASLPNVNKLHDELERLLAAAKEGQSERAAELRDALSARSLSFLELRASYRSGANIESNVAHSRAIGRHGEVLTRKQKSGMSVVLTVPTAGELCGPSTSESACALLASLCRGFAPAPTKTFPRRQAERYFVILLRRVWFNATGSWPAKAAREGVGIRGPFVRFVQDCLDLVGADPIGVVGIINDLNKRGPPEWQESDPASSFLWGPTRNRKKKYQV